MIHTFDARTQAQAWNTWLQQHLPRIVGEPYFDPHYIALHSTDPAARPLLFTYTSEHHAWARPMLLQPVPNHPQLFDLESPYGYTGPAASTPDPAFLAAADAAFTSWAHEHNAIAEFVRFHPLLENQHLAPPTQQRLHDRTTCSIPLLHDEIIATFSPKARNMVRRFERSGGTVESLDLRQHHTAFGNLYRTNMQRIAAESWYHFDAPWFARLADYLTACDGCFLVARDTTGAWQSAAAFLPGPRWLHYHLAASTTANRVPGAGNALLHAAAVWGQCLGFERLHLGGGNNNSERDPLFRFKAAMAPDRHEFFIGKRILLPHHYDPLLAAWRKNHPERAAKFGNRVLAYRYH